MEGKEELLVIKNVIDNIINTEKEAYTDDDKKRAAYALNLCMVSVSQIIDYNDVYILEQEYEAILNNLNLEMFPKDEALLTILKQLLDTITFFRIQEGDKHMIEKEYQHKMKNAIWNAVPNFGLIVSGDSVVNMAISLASQVGIGYMNYRRAKSENKLDYEKQQWELRRTAIDQFNGLRRELFDTAWRLADKYEFPDYYRLTERQIKQYNDILMDSDEIRRFERLTTIKDEFKAYPPFWYNYGSTANSIARDETLNLSIEAREYYKKEALSFFDSYWENNKYPLLREDHMSSSCALEQIDLLNIETDREKIEELLDKAIRFSGKANDILQLCAIAYLRIGQTEKASDIFRILVNEDYNKIVNAQLLSGLYVKKEISAPDAVTRSKYELLTTRVNPIYLYKMPRIEAGSSIEELQKEFNETQEDLLITKFSMVIDYCVNKYSIQLAKLIPSPSEKDEYPDYYYSIENYDTRKKDYQELFTSKHKQKDRKRFCRVFKESDYINRYFQFMNEMFSDMMELNCIKDRRMLQDLISNVISKNAQTFSTLLDDIEDENVTIQDINLLLGYSSMNFYNDFIVELKNQIIQTISEMKDMIRYSEADSRLHEFCVNHGIPEPDVLISLGIDAKEEEGVINKFFDLDLLDTTAGKNEEEINRFNRVEEIIKKYEDTFKSISVNYELFYHDSERFNEYFENSKLKNHKDILQKAIAIFNENAKKDADVLFTVDSVVPIIKNSVKAPIPYKKLIEGETNLQSEPSCATEQLFNNGPLSENRPSGPVFNGPLGENSSPSGNMTEEKSFGFKGLLKAGAKFSSPIVSLISNVMTVSDTNEIESLIEVLKPMFEEICSEE